MTKDAPQPKRRSRKRIVLYSIAGVLVAALAAAGIGYYELRPQQHFKQTNIPILAKPKQSDTAALPHDGEFNVLLLGIDARTPNEAARTDSIMIVHVNLNTHDYEAISIPRDTMVNLPGYGYTKITHANYMGELKGGLSQGTKDAIQAISDLTGLTINYYAETNFSGLVNMVDSVDGVDVYLPFDVTLEDQNHTVYKKGYHHVDGNTLLALTRERHTLAEGDFGRQQIQAEAVLALVKKMIGSSNVTELPNVISKMSQFLVTTNMSQEDMISFALGIRGINSSQVHYYQVPGHSAIQMDPIVGQKLYYWIPDREKLAMIIKEHFVD
jgi:LCP family protein required for cell wall assembly